MNDRDQFDPIDRTLSNAFGSRHVPPMSQPSLIDVRHRARRRQQRRTAGLVAAIVLVGASGVGVYALRHDGGRAALTPGDAIDDGAPSTTVVCLPMSSSTVPVLPTASTVSGPGVYVVKDGDTPAIVAQKFAITVDELNAANAGLDGYDAFIVGLAITIPVAQPILQGTTTLPAQSAAEGCNPDAQWLWHCTGDLGVDEFGRQVFESCEQVVTDQRLPIVVQSTIPGQPIGTTTTMAYYECPPNASCVPPGLTVVPTTVPIDANATTTTNVEYQSTTTSQG